MHRMDVEPPAPAFLTTDYLTKFEFARVLGMRQLQLQQHAVSSEDPKLVALRELLEGTSTTVVRRRLANGATEDRRVAQLRLTRRLRQMCVDMREEVHQRERGSLSAAEARAI